MHKGRSKITNRPCIRVDDKHVVMSDKYNVILAEICYTKVQGKHKCLPKSVGYYSKFNGEILNRMASIGISPECIEAYRKRIDNFTSITIGGELNVARPSDFQSDDNPFGEGIEDEAE